MTGRMEHRWQTAAEVYAAFAGKFWSLDAI